MNEKVEDEGRRSGSVWKMSNFDVDVKVKFRVDIKLPSWFLK